MLFYEKTFSERDVVLEVLNQTVTEASGRYRRARQDRRLWRDLKLLTTFVHVYCRDHHSDQPKEVMCLKDHDLAGLTRRPLRLCASCRRLLAHACVKRSHCPLHPKPACKNCPSHCYAPEYRQEIREVMKYSGRRLVMSGRVDYLWHLWF